MCDAIVHRGPDDEGIYVNGGVALGMRRLSIIDVAGGHQPIHNEDRSVWVVFNGEIYNFPQLRTELQARGHEFYTNSDTEVIVHLYEDLGVDCVQKLRGMFAFALYDERRQSLLLARDRLGIKPLHYAFAGERLLFGSEIKALLAVVPQLAEIDPEGLMQFFYFGYIADPHTAFKAIKKLPPGYLLEFRNGSLRLRQYWDLPAYGSYEPPSEEECLRELEHRLAEAVRVRLISDVPLGALLSGGVDSSIVVALMARASASPVKTFSIGFNEQQFNEAHHARKVAHHFRTEHHELLVEPNIGEVVQHLAGMMEEPFGDSSMIPTYYVCQMARQHVTVALSGDGGDELFAGYDRYPIHLQRAGFECLPDWVGSIYRKHVHPRVPSSAYGRNFAWNVMLPGRDRYLDAMSLLPALDRERNFFTPDLLAWATANNPLRQFQHYYDAAPAADELSRLLYLDTKTYLTADVLAKVDRMSMATSLEVRVPILDHELVEWVTSLPLRWKFRNGSGKYLLRKLARRLGVTADVLDRKKHGFQLPLADWMKNELRGWLQILLEPRAVQRDYFRPQAIQACLDEHMRGRRNRSGLLWRLLVLELWHRNFLEASPKYPHRPDLLNLAPASPGRSTLGSSQSVC